MYTLKKENTKVEVEVSIDNKEWDEAVQKVYEQTKGQFNVVGFRKGHAPRKMIEQQYGDSVFFQDTIDFFIDKVMNEVLYENPELEPVAMPTTQLESFTIDGGLKMKILFEIVPDFKLCKYKDVTIKVHSDEVTEKQIEHEIYHLLEANAKFEPVEREVKNGDNVLIDFTGYMDEVAFEGGAAQNYPLEIGSHSFIDTFEDQLIGHKKGDNVDVNVTFPENYGAPEFQGKKATFKVVINEVREKQLPTLDDKFISDTTEFETVEEYRKDLTAHIQDMKHNQQQVEFEHNMREYLVENTQIEIPESMVDTMVESDVQRMRDALKAYNMTLEEYSIQTGNGTIEEFIKGLKERTLTGIKVRYIYRKLIEENKLEIPSDELEKATKDLKDHQEKVKKENELVLEKLHKFLRDNNKIEILPAEDEVCEHCHH